MPTTTRGAIGHEALNTDGLGELLGAFHTQYWDPLGNPALALPMGFTDAGLPLSLQLAARPFEEALLVTAGDAYQTVTDWHRRVPPLAATVATA
jgi:aspartyl-tRNA(Asn)/glutamyl-tRNA(Gln) amidotransferase subunit A